MLRNKILVSCMSSNVVVMRSFKPSTSNESEKLPDPPRHAMNDWSGGVDRVVSKLIEKFGPPDEINIERMLWHNRGNYKHIDISR